MTAFHSARRFAPKLDAMAAPDPIAVVCNVGMSARNRSLNIGLLYRNRLDNGVVKSRSGHQADLKLVVDPLDANSIIPCGEV